MNDHNSIEDLLNDKSFRDWVLDNDPQKRLYWENWSIENQEKKEILLQAKMILLELDKPGRDWNDEKQNLLFSRIRSRIRSNNKNPSIPAYNVPGSKVLSWTRAAIITFFLVASFLVYLKIDLSEPDVSEEALNEIKEVWVTKSNPRGQKSRIHLPDGSSIILNAESEIRFRSDFGKNDRDIVLQGESFFEVASDSLLPFRVFSGELVTTALGTSFNINSYDIDRIQIQLATGKVKVVNETEEEQPMYLIPGEEILLNSDDKMTKKKFDLKKAFLWKDGTLLFDKTSFADFKVTLERWYGVEIEVANPPYRNIRISGEFQDTYLANILESIGYAYGFDYEINHKKVKINFNQTEDQ